MALNTKSHPGDQKPRPINVRDVLKPVKERQERRQRRGRLRTDPVQISVGAEIKARLDRVGAISLSEEGCRQIEEVVRRFSMRFQLSQVASPDKRLEKKRDGLAKKADDLLRELETINFDIVDWTPNMSINAKLSLQIGALFRDERLDHEALTKSLSTIRDGIAGGRRGRGRPRNESHLRPDESYLRDFMNALADIYMRHGGTSILVSHGGKARASKFVSFVWEIINLMPQHSRPGGSAKQLTALLAWWEKNAPRKAGPKKSKGKR